MNVALEGHRPALLLVDLQELFTRADGPFANTGGSALIEAVNVLLDGWRATRLPLLVSSYALRPDGLDAGLLRDHPVVREGLFAAGGEWTRVDRRLRLPAGTPQLVRNRPSAFWGGELDAVLRGLAVDALVLCGLSVNNALSATARDAFARDLPCVVVRDASGAAPGETHLDVYFAILDTWTAAVLETPALLAALRGAGP